MSIPVPAERIDQTIRIVRGHRVMLDTDLAKLYGVATKALNQAVKRAATAMAPKRPSRRQLRGRRMNSPP